MEPSKKTFDDVWVRTRYGSMHDPLCVVASTDFQTGYVFLARGSKFNDSRLTTVELHSDFSKIGVYPRRIANPKCWATHPNPS